MFSKLAILGAALLITAPVWAAASGGGTSSSGTAGSSGGGGGAHAGGGGGGGGGAHGGSLGAHGAAISTHAAAAHAIGVETAAHVMPVHGAVAGTPEAANHKPGKPGIPHPIFNPRYNRNYVREFPYPHFMQDCIVNFYTWSEWQCDRPEKATARR